jgi:hypothetical protein
MQRSGCLHYMGSTHDWAGARPCDLIPNRGFARAHCVIACQNLANRTPRSGWLPCNRPAPAMVQLPPDGGGGGIIAAGRPLCHEVSIGLAFLIVVGPVSHGESQANALQKKSQANGGQQQDHLRTLWQEMPVWFQILSRCGVLTWC